LFSVRQQQDVIFSKEIASLQRRFPNLHVYVTLSNETASAWAGERGRITAEMLLRLIPDLKKVPVYLCGPDPMMTGTRVILLGLGVPEGKIQMEAFTAAEPNIAIPRGSIEKNLPLEVVSTGESIALAAGAIPTVHFRRSGKVADLPLGLTILEAAEDAGLEIPFECRSGICGQCKTKLLAGQVTMDVEDGLSAGDRSNGIILACQAHSARDVIVDA
jgi:ferredoxin-NADP reductase